MLSPVLSKNDCSSCRFCCSFRRQSLWETPVFYEEELTKIRELFPAVKFHETAGISSAENKAKSFTFDISNQYKTDNPEEEATCPFLNPSTGCILPAELKPFDCKIWPLRVVKLPSDNNQPAVVLTPTCPAINKVPFEKIEELAAGGLGKSILDYAASHPQMIKEYSAFLSKIVFR